MERNRSGRRDVGMQASGDAGRAGWEDGGGALGGRLRARSAAALGVAAVVALTTAAGAQAIVRGERIGAETAPWAVSIQDPDGSGAAGSGHFCTGTAIGPRLVLTARHCTEHGRFHVARVMTGSADPAKSPGPRVRVARAWIPGLASESGSGDEPGDVAVLETAADLGVATLPLVPAGTEVAGGEEAWAYGYGRASMVTTPRGETALLRRAQLRLYSPSQCSESDLAPAPWYLCAGPGDGPLAGLVAMGDSGGPLVRQGAQGPEVLAVASMATTGPLHDRVVSYASVERLRGFLADPASGVELPRTAGRTRVAGRPRVGATVRCVQRFTPTVKRVEVSWYTVSGKRYAAVPRASGVRLEVPASARGKRLTCVARGVVGDLNGATGDPARAVGPVR